MPYRKEPEKPSCDASNSNGILLKCTNTVVMYCMCRRCTNEPDQRFYSCTEHVDNVTAKHLKVYGTPPQWHAIKVPKLSSLVKSSPASIVDRFIATRETIKPQPLKDDWGGAKQW